MFKGLKVGGKLFVGFGSVFLIFIAVGVIISMRMGEVSNMSRELVEASVPEMKVANEVERSALKLLRDVRGYNLTGDKIYYDNTQKDMEDLTLYLDEALNHARKHSLVEFESNVKVAIEGTSLFKELFNDASLLVGSMNDSKERASKAGRLYMDNTNDFLKEQVIRMREELSMSVGREALEERVEKIELLNEIIRSANDARIAFATSMLNRDPSYVENVVSNLTQNEERLSTLEAITHRDVFRAKVKENREAASSYIESARAFFADFNTLLVKREELAQAGEMILSSAREATLSGIDEAQSVASFSDKTIGETKKVIYIAYIVAAIVSLSVALFISRIITKPLINAVGLAKRAQGGDLSITREEFNIESRDEVGQLADALSEMLDGQRTMVKNVIEMVRKTEEGAEALAALSEETNASMEEIRGSVEQVADLSESNSAALQESNAGVMEVANGAQEAAKSAENGANSATETQKDAQVAVDNVAKVNGDIHLVGVKSEESTANLKKLASSVNEIANFVDTITGIADQTNLLALNAAIEAARAGEAGRGFAVVAEEVRKLSEGANNAAKKVSDLISALKENAMASIAATDETGRIMDSTREKADNAKDQLAGVLSEMRKIEEVVQNVASVSQEQAASSEEMSAAISQATEHTMKIVEMIENIRHSSVEASSASEGVAVEAQNMLKQTTQVKDLLAQFKLERQRDLPQLHA